MAQAKQAAEELLTQLQKGEAVLDIVARRLEDEFATRFSKTTAVNPLLLAKRLRKLAAELPSLQQDCQEVLKLKQDLIDSTKQHLIGNHTKLQQLCQKSGLAVNNDPALQHFQETVSEWEAQLRSTAVARAAAHDGGGAGDLMSRDDLNTALAGLALVSTR